MSVWNAYRDDIVFTFRKHQRMAEQAMVQLDSDDFFRKPGKHSNSVGIIVKHLAGNLKSRWTDFLTGDGDKPERDRDAEFILGPDDTRSKLLADWGQAWSVLLASLASLEESDWTRSVRIRGEEHSVMQAIHRSLTHTAYHVGQIVYLARLLKTDGWNWLTIPPGQSKQFGKPYLK
ncbi:MAG: DUF1572 family protein [Planctomycetes bacterium]|nr:DUF1572 family protein [Planctomycetota bacterium]